MAWVKIDDQFADHPKVLAAGPLASWLYVCGLTYCGRYLTDGWIPRSQVKKLADVDNAMVLAERLVIIGLWDETEDGFIVHDYLEYNPTREDVKAYRDANAKRQSEWRDKHRDKKGKFNDSNAVSNGVSNAQNNTAPSPSPSPSPSPCPVPEPKDKGAKTAPVTFEDWQTGFREATNKAGYAGDMLITLYPYYRNNKPNFGMLSKMLKDGDADYILLLIFQNSGRPPVGDPIKYIAGILSNRKPDREPPKQARPVDGMDSAEFFGGKG